MINLRYDYIGASRNGEGRHAQAVMKSLGIKYKDSTPQSIADQYWFWECENVPEELPGYITKLDFNKEDYFKE